MVRRLAPTDRRSLVKVGRNGCVLREACLCCPLRAEWWHGKPNVSRTCDREHPPVDKLCSPPYPKNIPPCPERATLPDPPHPPAGFRPLRYEVCVDCGRITARRWTTPNGAVVPWCAGQFPVHERTKAN